MSDHARRLAKVESALALGWTRGAPLQVISIVGGSPTESGRPEAEIRGEVLVLGDHETIEDFTDRVAAEAYLAGLRFVVIHGLPRSDEAFPPEILD